jgi:hypothetical protein
MKTFQQLRETSPQIETQYREFASQQPTRGAPDWQKFREYLRSQGLSDPGTEAPSDLQEMHQQAISGGSVGQTQARPGG